MRNHSKLSFIILGIFMLFMTKNLRSQVLDFQQNSPKVVWKQIQSENFQLIFPQELDSVAKQIANKILKIEEFIGKDLNTPLKKISIVLQNKNLIPNGFVQLAPRKSEMYVTSPQDVDGINWLETLVLHELRHVIQMDKVSGILKKPFFEQLAFALYGLHLPSWFFEGDAVKMETEFSPIGRGNIPSWSLPLKTQVLENKNYSYQKNYLGSYKDITPGHYVLGYHMIKQMKETYSANAYQSIWESLSKNPIQFYKLTKAWKKETGFNTKDWHKETLRQLKLQWEKDSSDLTAYEKLREEKSNLPFHEILPHAVNDSLYLYMRYGPQITAHLVLFNTQSQKEKTIKQIGFQVEPYFHYHNGWVVWDELRKHPRYNQEYYHVILAMELETGKTQQLTHKTRLFSPSIYPEKGFVATIENNEKGESKLILLNLHNPELKKEIKAPSGVYWQYPRFNDSGEEIVLSASSDKGMSLFKVSINTEDTPKIEQLLAWDLQKIEKPLFKGENILFKAHYEGKDEIYVLEKGVIYQITSSQYGSFYPIYDAFKDELLYSQYTHKGHRIVKSNWQRGEEAIRRTESIHIVQDNAQDSFFKGKIEPYKLWKNTLNFHSLSVSTDEFSDVLNQNLGLYWLSDDVLSQTKIRLGYEYNPDMRSSDFVGKLSFERYFPKFHLTYQNRGRLGNFRSNNEGNPTEIDSLIRGRWRENVAQITMEIPLSFYKRNQIISTGIQVQSSYTQRYNLNIEDQKIQNRFIDEIAFPMGYHAYLSHYQRRATLDLAPRWGYYVSLRYKHLPFTQKIKGESWSLRTTLYFPGLKRNHAFTTRFNYQHNSGTFANSNEIPMVHGYSYLKPTKVENTLLTQYMFPLIYPDWELGNIAYIKRVRIGLFADFENFSRNQNWEPRTFGLSAHFDSNMFRYVLPNFEWFGRAIIPTRTEDRSLEPVIFTYGVSISY